MNKEYLIDSIEKLINDETEAVDFSAANIQKTSIDSALANIAVRFVTTYIRFTDGDCGSADLLVSLRSFLLSFQTKIRFDMAANFSDIENYGLYQDSMDAKVYAVYDIPTFFPNGSFVEEAYIDADTNITEVKSLYCLKANYFVEELTGFKYFKSLEQKLCVHGALNTPSGYTSLISMPTGGGKSLITQVLGYEKKGLSIVIVPTVSLAIDQERAAKENIKLVKGNEIFCYYSGINNFNEIKNAIEKHEVRLLFISPEALIKNESFNQLISTANASRYLQNIIVDEAHIVVAWGDFFRVDYQCLSPWRDDLLKTNPELRTYLLSATYRDETVNSLKQLFSNGDDWLEIRCDALRKEPHFACIKTTGYKDKQNKVLELVNLMPHPMILYVNAPYEALKWKNYLEMHGYGNVRTFTGETKSDQRRELIDDWVNNKYDLMNATSAFGVGVDKPDVRTVIHLYMPESPDTYYQELGRGGRDGFPCLSIMCIEDDDITNAFNHVGKVLTNKINYFEEGNDTDEKWNINVLLLLNRKKQIQIVGLDLDSENRYIFTVKVLNDQITQDTAETKALFARLRDEESAKSLNAFSILRRAVERSEKICWSEMFYETYPLVSECCPGCNCHVYRNISEQNRFPLVVDVRGPEKCLSEEMKVFFGDTNEAVEITDDSISELIAKYKPDIVVSNSFDEKIENDAPGLMFMNYRELNALHSHDDGFYITGLVMAVYDDDPAKAKEEYQSIYKYIARNRYVIHVTKNDFCISSSTGKKLTELVDGTVIR